MNDAIKRADPCGDYEILQRVGGGSYGEVYKAKNLRNGELAAVKMVKLETGDNFAAIQQEILVLKECVHPNIISYYGSYLRPDRLWIVMEYCGGGSLQDIYQMTGALSELQIAFVCRETLKGISYLHRRGKVHRDVKGANILLTNAGEIKLADFGIAAQITQTLGKRQSFIGTPYWMAPEVANVGSRGGYSFECDVWAVGITAIELAETKPPYFDLQPMQVLYLMTKSGYTVPKLSDKKKWSPIFSKFIKLCLTKNPKKRPSPDKLLVGDPFVAGALSSRLTRDLLDRVNHPERTNGQHKGGGINLLNSPQHFLNGGYRPNEPESEQENDLVRLNIQIQSPHPNRQFGQKIVNFEDDSYSHSQPSSSSSKECLESADEDEVFGINGQNGDPSKQQSYHSERTLRASNSSQDGAADKTFNVANEAANENEKHEKGEQPFRVKRRPRDLRGLFPRVPRPISSASEQPRTSDAKANRLLSRIDESLKQRWLKFRSKSSSLINVPHYATGVNNSGSLYYGGFPHLHNPFQSRPLTCCFGMVPTPQVTMGACFITVLHQSPKQVNCCSQWFHPANGKQFMVIGAEEGIFALDLTDMSAEDEVPLIHLHERRCTWLYVVENSITALQGKTPYLYRHDVLQLFQQQLITQKLTKPFDKLPERLRPRALLNTVRIPETKDCFQCNVERSINDGMLYLCCAVPHAILLLRWYDPLARFVMLKRVELSKLSAPFAGPQHPHRPFNLVFGSGTANSDYPMVCVGISRALTSPVGTAQQLLHELRNKPQKDKLELQFVDFNDNSSRIQDLFTPAFFGDESSEEDGVAEDFRPIGRRSAMSARSPSIRTNRTIWRWREKLDNVVALKQLDRDTLFIAYGNQIVITDLGGMEKKTDLMVTSFAFDFPLKFAIPLSDSVLAFHKNGVQGKSFFRGTITQDLNDASKLYQLIGWDSLVVMKTSSSRKGSPAAGMTRSDDGLPVQQEEEEGTTRREDICVLTGHVSTMTPP